ncbi:S8 family serine peptidase [uncultured Roseobacter sp.]|uniref:S8 family serine peptidase n=1 Tax=uncultured Roseobacter sp. TaxID=114847 RepID=UPI002619AEC1|nr:S8 family serine peptidase [uncultured Roseobacter sp.]
MKRYLLHVLLASALVFVLPAIWHDSPVTAVAWADDDDDSDSDSDSDSDGGDSDDDDRDDRSGRIGHGGEGRYNRPGGGPNAGGNLFDWLFGRTPPPQTAQRSAPAPQPTRAAAEIVVLDLSDADLATLTGQGYEVIRTVEIAALGETLRRLRVPSGTALDAALEQIRELPSGQAADFNHFYRTNEGLKEACEGLHCGSFDLVGWRSGSSAAATCGRVTTRIGLIDTGINPDHEAFDGGRLSLLELDGQQDRGSGAQHGTAVAAILIGSRSGRAHGLLPDAELLAIDAFQRTSGDERSDVFTLVQAMDQLAGAGVDLINMSLAGPHNILLEEMVLRLSSEEVLIVSVSGNNGPRAQPVFPGAYAPVLTATAVDASGRIYRRAGRGPHVDLAAPGVEVWTAASIRGVRSKTGTSFAAPFATAAAAVLMSAKPDLTISEVKSFLRSTALDLGDEGPDETFGAGLVQFAPICSGRSPTEPALLE